MAPPTTKSPIIIITIGDEKPAKASVGVSTPNNRSVVKAAKAITSALILPHIKKMTVTIKTIRVVVIGKKNHLRSDY